MMAGRVELLVLLIWHCVFNAMYKKRKAVAIETVVGFIQSDCLWVPWEHKSSADHNGGQPGCNWTS